MDFYRFQFTFKASFTILSIFSVSWLQSKVLNNTYRLLENDRPCCFDHVKNNTEIPIIKVSGISVGSKHFSTIAKKFAEEPVLIK